jgi:flagellar basal-body rod modification protein FlgD
MFLNLLTAQIRNQDPLSPMDTTEWTNQLVQYSSVEQQLKANQWLEKIANGGATSDMNAAVGYIGKTVKADSNTATLKDGAATWDYTLGGNATAATLTVKDANGTTVWSGAAPDLTKGRHSVTWNGQDSAGNPLADGNYTLSVDAGTTSASVGISGTVTSVENTSNGVVLNLGNTSIPLTSITSVS